MFSLCGHFVRLYTLGVSGELDVQSGVKPKQSFTVRSMGKLNGIFFFASGPCIANLVGTFFWGLGFGQLSQFQLQRLTTIYTHRIFLF